MERPPPPGRFYLGVRSPRIVPARSVKGVNVTVVITGLTRTESTRAFSSCVTAHTLDDIMR